MKSDVTRPYPIIHFYFQQKIQLQYLIKKQAN